MAVAGFVFGPLIDDKLAQATAATLHHHTPYTLRYHTPSPALIGVPGVQKVQQVARGSRGRGVLDLAWTATRGGRVAARWIADDLGGDAAEVRVLDLDPEGADAAPSLPTTNPGLRHSTSLEPASR